MNKLIPRFFTRLYTTMTIAIFASVYLTIALMSEWIEQDDVEDFLRDTSWVFQVLESVRDKKQLAASEYYLKLDQELYPFQVTWSATNETPCNDCVFVGHIVGADVYKLDDGRMLSKHQITGSLGFVILEDIKFEPQPETSTTEFTPVDIEELMPFLILFSILVTIAITLYLPIRKLQHQINQLNTINQQFGKGDLDVRADKNTPEPLRGLALSFNNMAQQLADNVTENQIFAQAVPHELRTPLSRIQLAAGIIRADCDSLQQQQLLDNIDQYITDIDELCSQVITFSQVNAHLNKDKHQQIFIKPFITTSVSRFPLQSAIDITLVIDDSLSLTTDHAYLRLIVDNLIKNAINHASSKIVICATTSIADSNETRLSIEDDGNGIEAADFDTIFIPYSRLDKSRSRKTGGLGLGLAIAQNAAKRLNSKIHVSKSALGGAKFSWLL